MGKIFLLIALSLSQLTGLSARAQAPLLQKIFISTQQSIDPWSGQVTAVISNPSGKIAYEFIEHGFRLHLPISATEIKTLTVFFDRPMTGDQEQAALYMTGNSVFRRQLEVLQKSGYGLIITIPPSHSPGFLKSFYDSEDLFVTFVKMSEGQAVSSVTINSLGASGARLPDYIAQTIASLQKQNRPAPKAEAGTNRTCHTVL